MTMMRYSLVTCVALAWISFAQAASPQLAAINPKGMQRGAEQVVTFTGNRLGDAQEIIVHYPGIKVTKLQVVNDTTLQVTLNVAADCRLGEHLFRVRTATGMSDGRTLWIGALPVVQEVEPNSDFDKPQPVPLNSTVHGAITNEDIDYYVVECKKGQRLSVEVEGNRLGLGFWDPFIAILNEKRFELITNDDNTLTQQDPGCSLLVPADGKYIIMIRESAYGPGTAYRLHIGNFPRPTGVVPAGGKPGEEIEFRFLGDPLGEIKQKIKLPTEISNLNRLHCQTADGIMPTGFKIHMDDLPNVIESGANITPAAATVGKAPCAFNGVISKNGERKYFKFTGQKGQVFDIFCRARNLGSPLDPVLTVTRPTGQQLLINDDTDGADSYVRFTVPDDGEYVLVVDDHLKKGGMDYFFRLEVSPMVASSESNLPKVDGNNRSNQDRLNITVPKGGRYATMVMVNRVNWGGVGYLQIPGLPSGVTPRIADLEPGAIMVPAVFEARSDLANSGHLVEFLAVPADTKQPCIPRTGLDLMFNPGQNNYPYHKHVVNKIAVAITEPSPYTIDVIEPKAAIPQNSTYNLRVVVKRSPGFNNAILISPLYSPPGIGIVNSAIIKENENEGVLTVNAAPNAATRKWPMAINAQADQGKGPVWVSSQMFNLEVGPTAVTIAQDRASVEQGQSTAITGKVEVATPFEGEATIKLIGLPTKATAPDIMLKPSDKTINFHVTTDKTTPAGKHNLFCQVILKLNGETFIQNAGGGELRVDVPLPPKMNAPAQPTTSTTPAPPANTPAKPLSKLEQLRKEQEEREKAQQGSTPPKKS